MSYSNALEYLVSRLEEERALIAAEQPFDPFAGGFPVPPMPGQPAVKSRHDRLTVTAQGEGN